MNDVFSQWLLETSILGSVLIGFVLCIRPLVRRVAGAGAVTWLWAAVLVRLLCPWTPDSPWQVGKELSAPLETSNVRWSVQFKEGKVAEPKTISERPTHQPRFPWFFIYATGVFTVAALTLVKVFRASELVRKAEDISDAPQIRSAMGALRWKVKSTSELASPALAGLFRPILLLPSDWAKRIDNQQLECVLRHEMGHWKRWDRLWQLLFVCARAVHWFNPFVWVADRVACVDREIACDAWVLTHSTDCDATTYGETLLSLASAHISTSSPLHAGMAAGTASLRSRFSQLRKHRKPTQWAVASAILAACAGLILTGPIQAQDPSKAVQETTGELPPAEISVVPAPKAASNPPSKPPPHLIGKYVELDVKLLEFADSDTESLSLIRKLDLDRARNLTSEQVTKLIHEVSTYKNVELMTAPRVTCRNGEQALIEVVREFRYPTEFMAPNGATPTTPKAFETQNVGVEVDVTPTIVEEGNVELELSASVTEFSGFINYGSETEQVINQPIFEKRRIQTFITVRDGETVVVGGTGGGQAKGDSMQDRMLKPDVSVPFKESSDQKNRSIYIIVTARIVEVETSAHFPSSNLGLNADSIPPAPPSQTAAPSGGVFPLAIPVLDRAGFFKSPHAQNSGYVDLRGFATGTEAKCPYTGKIFLVP